MHINLHTTATRAPEGLDKQKTKSRTAEILERLSELQNLFYADGRHALLVVLQGMDASGKDGLIRNVFTSMNPQGVSVTSFKKPTEEELAHDFLWRVHCNTPAKGMIKIFNRSHYEDILITRVLGMIDEETALHRIQAINHFEELLTRHGNTTILKFFLHISKEEQIERLDERLTMPHKRWKYNENDMKHRALWDKYMSAYEDCFQHCSNIPWNIIPSDQNWYKEYLVAKTVLDAMENLHLRYPGLPD